ncbi:MAG TPA: 4a-hydroxytetrahydrobiopterin dehydratase [Acidimicrobiia bacterium]|nr:4a-hydroxytetrahydrobiopterin dehydratase [Acidimicrobiia bacterium]
MPPRLDDAAISEWLAAHAGWEREGDEIRRRFERPSFADAIAFVVRIGFLAEAANHHPDLDIRWRTVVVALTTHDAGGLTTLDLNLAESITASAGG